MRHNPDYSWLFNYFRERPEEERVRFLQQAYKRMLNAHSPQEIALEILEADTPVEAALKALGGHARVKVAQKVLGVHTPAEVAQKALGVETPVEVALKVVQTEEQRRELLARLQQMAPQTAHAAASA